jgi:hypothetical protein
LKNKDGEIIEKDISGSVRWKSFKNNIHPLDPLNE